MKLNKNIQKILSNKNDTFQFVMETLIRDYIYSNLDAVIKNDK